LFNLPSKENNFLHKSERLKDRYQSFKNNSTAINLRTGDFPTLKTKATYSSETSEHFVLSQQNAEPQTSYSEASEIALEAVKSQKQL
jgi:hypothetical protein